MSTNSQIFYEKSPNVFHGISCNFDGYISGVGATLYKHYQTLDKIEKLISLGDISSLDKECDIAPQYQSLTPYNNEQRHFGYTFAYHRDLNHPFTPLIIENDIDKLIQYSHVYVWMKNKWFTYNYSSKEWILLKDALMALANENGTDPHRYIYIPKTIELILSYDDYFSTIRRGFLISQKDNVEYSVGDYIKFKAIKDHQQYELLLKVNEILDSNGIKENYQLIILSEPPQNFAWFYPVHYS